MKGRLAKSPGLQARPRPGALSREEEQIVVGTDVPRIDVTNQRRLPRSDLSKSQTQEPPCARRDLLRFDLARADRAWLHLESWAQPATQ
jgi:hypothetical protein